MIHPSIHLSHTHTRVVTTSVQRIADSLNSVIDARSRLSDLGREQTAHYNIKHAPQMKQHIDKFFQTLASDAPLSDLVQQVAVSLCLLLCLYVCTCNAHVHVPDSILSDEERLH